MGHKNKNFVIIFLIFLFATAFVEQSHESSYLDKTIRSENFTMSRVSFLIIHYTAQDTEHSLDLLTKKQEDCGSVSAHYLINPDGYVYALVDEKDTAWHAGESLWGAHNALNSSSIGIELVHPGLQEDGTMKPFPTEQVKALIALAKDIVKRYNIPPRNVLGHSDIAPERKQDPGPAFPWYQLYKEGIGAWWDEASIQESEDKSRDLAWIQKNLKLYGYNVQETNLYDEQTKSSLIAFQMHFRPSDFSGLPDKQTCAILAALVKKYVRPSCLELLKLKQKLNSKPLYPKFLNFWSSLYAFVHRRLINP